MSASRARRSGTTGHSFCVTRPDQSIVPSRVSMNDRALAVTRAHVYLAQFIVESPSGQRNCLTRAGRDDIARQHKLLLRDEHMSCLRGIETGRLWTHSLPRGTKLLGACTAQTDQDQEHEREEQSVMWSWGGEKVSLPDMYRPNY